MIPLTNSQVYHVDYFDKVILNLLLIIRARGQEKLLEFIREKPRRSFERRGFSLSENLAFDAVD